MANKIQAPTNSVNDAHKTYKQSRTTFPMTYLHYTTELYGLLNPFFAMEGVEGDTIPLNSLEDLRTHTLQAPLMSKVSKNKDYYVVPMRAILPKTFELIYANPTQGDDIPEDANCTFNIKNVLSWISAQFMADYSSATLDATTAELIVKFVLTAESFLSNGSLLAKMGVHLSPLFRYRPADSTSRYRYDFDQWFDLKFVPWLKSLNPIIESNGRLFALDLDDQPIVRNDLGIVSTHRFLEIMRDDMSFDVSSLEYLADAVPSFVDLFGNASEYTILIPTDVDAANDIPATINIARLLAYQLVSFHYYSNDKIDSIYSAALYRGLMQSMAGNVVAGSDNSNAANINSVRKYFTYNGELLEYDLFSEAVTTDILNNGVIYGASILAAGSTLQAKCLQAMAWLRNVFGLNQSLRYGDYFTGARPQVLAVGDVNTTVVNNEVNAVDMTKSLLMQRFLNSVNRVGRRFSNYVQMLSGRLPAPTPTDPNFLAHSANDLGSFEVENTAENQGNIVTLMRDGSSRWAFSYDVNEPCVIIGVSWYEVARIYSKTIDRQIFHRTRFDMFNKFFQYEGDQAIYRKELDSRWLTVPTSNFAYTLRYMEYKQRPSIATGGFVKHLPGHAFVTDNDESGSWYEEEKISPEYIRARPSEFDRFYASLTGNSLGSYFHFIVRYVNECPAERPMEYAPSVL